MSRRVPVDWVCDYCGEQGTTVTDLSADGLNCPSCGEPVMPR